MNNESDRQIHDQEVSRTYKALASETVPETLNQNIFRMAAADGTEKKPAAGFLAVWSKPLAWAATIGLSLVIVMQVSQPPGPQLPQVPQSAPAPVAAERMESKEEFRNDAESVTPAQAQRSLREEFVPQSQNTIEEANQMVELQAGPNRSEVDNVSNFVSEPVSADIADDDGSARFGAPVPAASAARTEAYSSIESEEKRLEKSARSRQDALPESRCDAASRASAPLWAACIEDLRKTSDNDTINREIELLRIKFPAYIVE